MAGLCNNARTGPDLLKQMVTPTEWRCHGDLLPKFLIPGNTTFNYQECWVVPPELYSNILVEWSGSNIDIIRKLRILTLMKLVFFETPLFTRLLSDYLNDDGYRALQRTLLDHPKLGNVMPGTGGFRKIRWADPRRKKGKRGGLRIIYYYLTTDNQVWFFTLYDKNEATGLTSAEKKELKKAIQVELEFRRRNR